MSTFFRQAKQLFPYYFVIIIWLVNIVSEVFNFNLHSFGVHPRHFDEWYTMFTGAFIHGSWGHLFNNSYPIIICGLFIYFIFEEKSNQVFLLSYILSSLLIFLFARSSTYHIGASGIAYSWAFLLAASGFFRKDKLSFGLGMLVVLLYGSMIWGILPIQPGVSWDGHLYGAISGIIVAYSYRNVNKKIGNSSPDKNGYNFERFEYGNYKYIQRKKKKKFKRYTDETGTKNKQMVRFLENYF